MKKRKIIREILAFSVLAGIFTLSFTSCKTATDPNKTNVDVSKKDPPVLYKDPQNYEELYANLYMPVNKVGALTVYDEDGNKTIISDKQLKDRDSESVESGKSVGWHPLKKPVTVQKPITEFFFANEYNNSCYENYAGGSSEELGTGSSSAKILGVGDFDGDYRDEVFILYCKSEGDQNNFTYSIYDKVNGTDSVITVQTPMDSSFSSSHANWIMPGELAQDVIMAGDVNGDGIDELILTDAINVYVYSVGVSSNTVTLLQKIKPVAAEEEDNDLIKQLIVGDFNNDGIDDVITVKEDVYSNVDDVYVYNAGKIEFFKGSSGSKPLSSGTLISSGNFKTSTSKQQHAFCKGDYDGDDIPEIYCIYSEKNDEYGYAALVVYSVMKNQVLFEGNYKYNIPTSHGYAVPVCADVDGDGQDEIFFGDTLYKPNGTDLKQLDSIYFTYAYYCLRPLAGDYNGDRIDEIYFVNSNPKIKTATSKVNHNVCVYKYYSDDDGGGHLTNIADTQLKKLEINPTEVPYTKFIVGNFDNDSSKRFRYTGHELTFSDPKILAVLCASPYSQAIVDSERYEGYGPGDWSTSFSSGKSNSEGKSQTFGLSAGVGIGFELNFGAVSADSEVMITGNFNKSFSKTTTVSKEITCSGTAAYDHVIFTSIPVDHFYYEITDLNPDSKENGKVFEITVPRSNTISNMSVDSYNKRNGNFPDVMPRVHTVGQPHTYLSKTEARAKAYLPAGASEDYRFIIEDGSHVTFDDSVSLAGGNANELTISVEHESEVSNGKGVEVSVSTELSGGIFSKATAKAEFGVSYDAEWSQTTGKGTSFSGTIGSLPESWINEHPEDDFTAGMYVYNQDVYVADSTINLGDLKDGDIFTARRDSYWVVTYWVE